MNELVVKKHFVEEQEQHIVNGAENQRLFFERIKGIIQFKIEGVPKCNNILLSGATSIGKTHVIDKVFKELDITPIMYHSAMSMNAFMKKLATIAYKADGKRVYVWLEDADRLFSTSDGLTALKSALDNKKPHFCWNKDMSNTITSYVNSGDRGKIEIAKALLKYRQKGGVGIEIPTHNMSFIATTNRTFKSVHDAKKTDKDSNEVAVISRFNYIECGFKDKSDWGFIAAGILDTYKDADLTPHYITLQWLWDDWDVLRSKHFRDYEKMLVAVVAHPTNYKYICKDMYIEGFEYKE